MAKTLADIKAAMQKELEEEQKRLEREEGKRFSSSQTSGNSSSGKTSNNTQSSAQSSAAAAQAKANKEADLIGAKDSAKLNSVIEKVPAKSSAAEKAKNSSASGGNLGTSKQAVGDFIAKAAGAQEGIDKIEAAKTEKAAAQAKENKEKDLIGFDGHAYQQQLAQQKEAERLEYLNIKEARDRKYSLEQELEKAKAQAKEETAKAGTVQIVASGRKGANNSFVSPETQKRIDELEKEISDINKNINLASRKQEGKYLYNSAVNAEDFEEYSKATPKKEEEQKSAVAFKGANQKRENETLKGYMNDEEKAVYNYYLNKFGKEKAEEFVESIEEELNYRKAQAIFAGNEGKVLNEYLMGAQAGLESAKEGYQGAMRALMGDESFQPTNYTQYLSGMAREDLADAGFKLPEALGGSSIGQIGFDFTNTTANMLPSLVLGTLGGAGIGAAAIGASAAGNAYNSAITEGYSKEQAANYAALVGGSEAALGYILGGIEATGGKISKAVLGKVLPKIDNALAKAAVNVGGKMLSEFSEEYLQEVLSPVFENIALMEDNEIDLLSPEAIYSGILGALSAGGIAVFDGSANVPEAIQKAKPPVPFEGTAQPGTEAGIVADKISEIENRPISEAEKAAKIEEVMEAVAETTQSQEAINEAGKVAEFYKNRQAEFDEAVEIGKKLGISVELDPNIAGNGIHTSDGRIIINPNTENPALQVFVHELTHDIETSGLYESFSKKILEHASQIGLDVNKIREMVIEDYKAAGHDLTDTQADAEIVAKYCEQHLFTDEKAIDRLLSEDRSLFQKIKDWISDMIVKFKGAPEEKFLLEAERLYEKALATRGEVSGIDSEAESVGRGFDEMAGEAKADEMAADVKTVTMERADKNLDIEGWKSIAEGINPEIGIWRMKDFARVLDNAAGGNKNLRQKLHDLYEKPLNEAQGNYARNYEAKVKDIAEKFKELGIKAGSKESAAVQRIGEGAKEIDKHGNTVPYTLDDLKKDFPESWEQIKEGADYCRKIYDEFLVNLNTMYSEIYPATVEQANEKVSSYDVNIQNYAKHVDNYTEVIKKLEDLKAEKQVELSKKRKDTIVYAELQNQIVNIDKKIEIANERIRRLEGRKFTKQILRDTLKSQIENGEILRNKQITPRKDYFRHFQELTDEFAEIADIFSNDQRIPPNLAGKSETTKPRTIWTSITQSRKDGNYYTEDAVGGLLKYTEIAEKLLVFDPLISHFRDVNSAVRAAGTMVENEVKGKGTNAGQFAAWADDMTNQLAGKTNAIDRFITDRTGAFGRATIKAVEALNRRVKSNAILGNFRSALVQIGNLPNATLYIQNPKDWAAGAISLTNPTEEIKEARAKSNFLSRRYMGDAIDNITKEIQDNNILHKPKEFALWMLSAGDKAAAELIWHTAYSRAINNPEILNGEKGLRAYENAIDYADDITRRSVAGRAEGDIPYFEESKITGLVAPFQIEVANTANALAEQIGKKNAKGIIAFEVGVWLINTVLEGITGDRPLGFDYIDAITDIAKELTGEEEDEEKNAWDKVTSGLGRLAGETISGLPFGAQIGSIISGGDEKRAEEWFGDSDPSRYGTGNIGIGALVDAADYFIDGETPKEFFDLATDGEKNSYREWSRPIKETVDTFAPLLMPWGGKQLARTVGGIDQLISGGAFGKDSNGEDYLKFPQEYDPESVIKTLLFGQYASDRGTEYIDSNFRSLSAKDTANMDLANEYGVSNEDFFDTVLGLKEFKTKEEKQDALFANEDLSAREKSIIDWVLFGDGKGFPEATRDYTSEQAFWESGLSNGEIRLNEDGYNREEIRLIEYAFEKGKDKVSTIEWIQKTMDCTEAEAYEIYQRREGKWIDDPGKLPAEEQARAKGAADLYGMSEENFLKVLNYSNFGVVKDGEYSNKKEDVIKQLMKANSWSKEKAEELYNRVNLYEYSREDLEDAKVKELQTSQEWYGVDDKGYFVARNVIKTAEGTTDKYGNTVSGSVKEAAVKAISEQLGVDETEATVYYLAAKGELVLSKSDLTTSQREDLDAAKKEGWTERQYLDAVNILKVSGATKKDDIIKTLMDGGASYEMAQGYYNLRQNKDYDRTVSTGGSGGAGYSYGMKTQKQADKGDYFLANYNSDGSLTAKDIAKWYAEAAGCSKKQEYLDAYQRAGATYSQALKFYNLMRGYDQSFNNYYKQKG